MPRKVEPKRRKGGCRGRKSPASTSPRNALAAAVRELDQRLFYTNRYLSFVASSLAEIAKSRQTEVEAEVVSCDGESVATPEPSSSDEQEHTPDYYAPPLPFPNIT